MMIDTRRERDFKLLKHYIVDNKVITLLKKILIMYKLFLSLMASVFLLGSCASTQNTERMVIASQQGDCVGIAPMKCLLVKTDGQPDWEFFYSNIEGFDYEPGYEYVLEVKKETRKNPAADQSAIRYTLVKEISKTRKTSENLPESVTGVEIIETDIITDSIE